MCSAGHVISTSIREDILATKTLINVLLNSKNLLPTPSELVDRGHATINLKIKCHIEDASAKDSATAQFFSGTIGLYRALHSQPTWEG